MRLLPSDREWLRPRKVVQYMTHEGDDPDVGKYNIYLGTAALPGTFGSTTRGTVTKAWARLHHPGWYRDVTGEGTRRT